MEMTLEQIMMEIERRLGKLNEKSREAVQLTLKLMSPESPSSVPTPPTWQDENPPFEEMAQLNPDERGQVMNPLEKHNKMWLEWKCAQLGAGWLVVVDGQVMAHGATLADNPLTDEQMLKLCHKTGKLPLLYIHPKLLMIEEGTAWNSTIYPNDFYPTSSVTFAGDGASVDVTADFDTGGVEAFTDLDLLRMSGVVHLTSVDISRLASHLGRQFTYIAKLLTVSLRAADGSQRSMNRWVICVSNWHQSPFVLINPNRAALVGRELCQKLQPFVSLDFAKRQTILRW